VNPATARRLDRARRIPRQHIKLYPGGRFWVKSQATAKNVGYVGQLKWKGSKVVAAGCSCPDCQKGLERRAAQVEGQQGCGSRVLVPGLPEGPGRA
jgi:hypothetical protein